jgi:hypothetical protein
MAPVGSNRATANKTSYNNSSRRDYREGKGTPDDDTVDFAHGDSKEGDADRAFEWNQRDAVSQLAKIKKLWYNG